MEFNIDYNIIMYILVGIIIIYIIFSILGSGKIVEGMANKTKTKPFSVLLAEGDHKELTKVIQKMDDTILIDKYRSDYEDMLVNLEEVLNQYILVELLVFASTTKTDVSEIKYDMVEKINSLYKLRDNLSSTMDYIDGKKSTNKGSGFF